MKTSELLVCVLVFLFGYMLFKRCGCKSVEGWGTVTLNSQCNFDGGMWWDYVNQTKVINTPAGLPTNKQCADLIAMKDKTSPSPGNKNPLNTIPKICNALQNGWGLITFGQHMSNTDECAKYCKSNMYCPGCTWDKEYKNCIVPHPSPDATSQSI
jgi:hypothetical protein